MLWLLQPQLPFMHNSCFDFPWPPVVNGYAAVFGSFVMVPLLLYKSRDAVGPRAEVRARQGPPPQLMKLRLTSLRWGFRDQGDSGVAVAGVPLVGRMWAETCLPMIIQPDDGPDTGLLCLSAKLPFVGKRGSAARA